MSTRQTLSGANLGARRVDEIPQGKDVNEEENKGTPILCENWASQTSVSSRNLVQGAKTVKAMHRRHDWSLQAGLC